jgi:hypothetical protein
MHTQNKSTAAGHTKGAERAARRISACFPGPKPSDDLVAEFVETINDETGHAELLDALEELLADKYLADPINADRMAHARAAVARAKGQ